MTPFEELAARNREALRQQPAPVKNGQPAIQDLVIDDLRKFGYGPVANDQEVRKETGLRKYGTLLQAFNGRDALLDTYEEALDLMNYARQAVEEATNDMDLLLVYQLAINQAVEIRRLLDARRGTVVPDEHVG